MSSNTDVDVAKHIVQVAPFVGVNNPDSSKHGSGYISHFVQIARNTEASNPDSRKHRRWE